ncbi:Rhodanese domain protein [Hymenobacter roseosalivarius DSM 11622]|uniref:Rhodanese domain protein n=1 Tax=Hymenobacter roseosalivarius DSM 11622 TaxID=645990 RepID=A0A1W1W3G1_9BACT|nr:rhodanese-like domain-containing protein [Hymenobacter roseosalivarius]SMC00159.1 Rhodanese domain protein [Hymenobacter roseosalivarius DSM 11622]
MKILSRVFGLLYAIVILVPCASAQKAPQQVSKPVSGAVDAATAAKLIKQPNVVILDVRTPAEYATGHVRGAKNLDFRAPNFAQQIAHLDPIKTYLLYCASGNRSGQATKLMQTEGFPKVVDAGAFKTLQAGGLKIE